MNISIEMALFSFLNHISIHTKPSNQRWPLINVPIESEGFYIEEQKASRNGTRHRFYGNRIQEQDMTVYSTPSAWAGLARLHDACAVVRGPI